MNNFKKIAQQVLSLTELAIGREKLDTEVILEKPLTITAFDLIVPADGGNPYAAVLFAEFPGYYYTGGVVLTKLVNAWCAGFDSIEEASEELEREGGVTVMFHDSKTKNNQNVTTITVC